MAARCITTSARSQLCTRCLSSTAHLDAATVHEMQSNDARGAHELEKELEEQLEGQGTAHEVHRSEEHPPKNSKRKSRARAILDGEW